MLKIVKEICNKLIITYKGINEVWDAHINRLVQDYELFCMFLNESISDIYTMIIKIIKPLYLLVRSYKLKNYLFT